MAKERKRQKLNMQCHPGIPAVIVLDGYGVGGYVWQPWLPLPDGISVEPLPPEPVLKPLPGAAARQRFQVIASQPGTYAISFAYLQPWAPQKRPNQILQFTLLCNP